MEQIKLITEEIRESIHNKRNSTIIPYSIIKNSYPSFDEQEKRYVLYAVYLLVESITIQQDLLLKHYWNGKPYVNIANTKDRLQEIKNDLETLSLEQLYHKWHNYQFVHDLLEIYDWYDQAFQSESILPTILQGEEEIMVYPHVVKRVKLLHPFFYIEQMDHQRYKK